MSAMTSNSHPAPQESSSTAGCSTTSPAAAENTKIPASKPSQDVKYSFSSPLSQRERVTQQNAAAQDHFDARADKRKKEKEDERKETAEKNKARNTKLSANKQANLYATMKYNSDAGKKARAAELQRKLSMKQALADQKKSKSIRKQMGQKKTEPNMNRVKKSEASTKPKQPQLPNAGFDSASTKSPSTSHDTSSSPVLASALGDVPNNDFKPLASVEKLQSSAPGDGFNKHGKRFLDEDEVEQVTSELSSIHRSKRARSLEPYISPREKNAHVASRRGSLGANAMPSSTYNSVTAYSATVNGGFVTPFTGDMTPFGADGDASLKYSNYEQQHPKESHAEFKEQGSTKTAQKIRASEPLLEPMAKKLKQSDKATALLREAKQAKEEPTAEAKPLELDDVIEKPEVASSAGDKAIQVIDHATPALYAPETATGEEASATETKPTTKEEAKSNNNEDNKSLSSSAEESSNDEKKVAEQTSKTDTASANTSAPKNDQDATQGDNKTSQTSDEKSAESSSNQTAKSTSKTQDGQTCVNTTASTTTSSSATETTTQQNTAQKSEKNNAQDQFAEVSKKPATNSDNIDTDDEAHSATEKPVKKKPATKAKPKPQRKAKANEEQHPPTNEEGSAVSKKSAAKKSTSKSSAVKQPSESTQQSLRPRLTGTARFVPTSKEDRKTSAAHNATVSNKQPLADKTNTNRQPTTLGSKKAPGSRTKEQPETAEKQSTQVKLAASRKRKHNGDDVVESNPKPAEKKQRQEQSKKRSRKREDEDDDDDAGSTKKNVKKQRTNLSSTTTTTQPDPDTSASFNPDRASRSRAAAQKRAATAAATAPRQRATQYDYSLPSGGYDSEDEVQPQDQAQTQPSGPVNEDEQTEENGKNDERIKVEEAEHGVEYPTSNATSNDQGAPATANAAAQPQRRPGGHIYRPANPPRAQAPRPRNNRSRVVYE